MKQILVKKGRTKIITMSLGMDVSQDEFKSEIREAVDRESEVIAEWDVSFEDDGTNGELRLVLDDAISGEVTQTVGYMDVKRITAGEPIDCFDDPIEVLFQESVTT